MNLREGGRGPIHIIETLLRYYNRCQRGFGMMLHLGAMTCHTRAPSGPNILLKARPNKFGPYQLGRGLHTWMTKAMDSVQDPASPASRHHRVDGLVDWLMERSQRSVSLALSNTTSSSLSRVGPFRQARMSESVAWSVAMAA